MKISFRTVDDGLKNEIFLDETFIGEVEFNIWNQKWKVNPYFNFSAMEQAILYKEYESAYKAGKALVELYNNTYIFSDVGEDEDTQEIDMRGYLNQQSPKVNLKKKKKSKYYINLNKPKP
jgi:hypothetical protein